MSWATRGFGFTRELAREVGMLLPRTVAGLNEIDRLGPGVEAWGAPVR
jgi:hypothetical protein